MGTGRGDACGQSRHKTGFVNDVNQRPYITVTRAQLRR